MERGQAPELQGSLLRSPHRRLVAGVALMLALFLGFGIYTVQQMRQLRRFQSDVLERNRKDSLQLARIQRDIYLLGISVRDMVSSQPRVPISVWGIEFRRLRIDLGQALAIQRQFAPPGRINTERDQLEPALQQFWAVSDQAFQLARTGYEDQALHLVNRELTSQRMEIENIVARWLDQNERDEQATAAAMNSIYSRVLHDFLALTVLLVALGCAVAWWALRANRESFQRVETLAHQLDARSRDLEDMSWRLLSVQEETLKQISRDLHDEFGQILTALGASLARIERRTAESSAGGANAGFEELRRARGIVQEAQQKIRSLSQLLRPTLLDDFGLEKTLEWYAGEFTRQTGIDTHFERSGEIPYIRLDAAIQLYRIAQEALTNAARHGKPQHARIRLSGTNGSLVLEIEDDGRGFGPAQPIARGVGLVSMQERAKRLHGHVTVHGRSDGRGTVVSAEVPVDSAQSADVKQC